MSAADSQPAKELMDLEDVVLKLVGPVVGVGETHEDNQRLKNIKVLTDLVDGLLVCIRDVATDADCHEYSRKQIGSHAKKFLEQVKNDLTD